MISTRCVAIGLALALPLPAVGQPIHGGDGDIATEGGEETQLWDPRHDEGADDTEEGAGDPDVRKLTDEEVNQDDWPDAADYELKKEEHPDEWPDPDAELTLEDFDPNTGRPGASLVEMARLERTSARSEQPRRFARRKRSRPQSRGTEPRWSNSFSKRA